MTPDGPAIWSSAAADGDRDPAAPALHEVHPHAPDETAGPAEPSVRSVVEFLILLLIAAILLRGFVAEAFLVPSGSMAISLLGFHKRVVCSDCQKPFCIGVEEGGATPSETICPNCGRKGLTLRDLPVSAGDRLLVQKWFYDLRAPRRWETVVFRHPTNAVQPYVKRVVGLPGESVQLKGGDVYVNGHIQRKTFEEWQKIAVPVHEQRYFSRRPTNPEHWGSATSVGVSDPAVVVEGTDLRLDPEAGIGRASAVFRSFHVDGTESAVRDENSYNSNRPGWESEPIEDLILRGRLRWEGPVTEQTTFRIRYQATPARRLELRWEPHSGALELRQDGLQVRRYEPSQQAAKREIELAFGLCDQRCVVRIDGKAPWEDFEFDGAFANRPQVFEVSTRPFAIDVVGAPLRLCEPRIDRDVHYTTKSWGTTDPTAVDRPYQLGADEYFVLGDNSSISNDSRLWDRPAVPHRLLIGKPVLVHLPSRSVRTQVFGREIQCSLPDLSKFRRVH